MRCAHLLLPLFASLCATGAFGADAEADVEADAGAETRASPAAPARPPPPPTEASSCATDASRAAALLTSADDALAEKDLAAATARYEAIIEECPESTAARDARRVLMGLRAAGVEATHEVVAPQDGRVIYQLEPFSRSTRERLRLTTWEKMDFAVTSFVYGLSVGISFTIALQPIQDPALTLLPVVFASSIYLIGSIAYLAAADPDRGDLPLVLAITSYAPTLLVLAGVTLSSSGNVSREFSGASALVGLAAFPIALWIANDVELDPGDTQLVRDGGFWGMALGFGIATGFAGSHNFGYRPARAPPLPPAPLRRRPID